MGLILDSNLADLLVIVATLLFFLYRYFTSTFDYFKVRGIPYLEPTPFFGNIKDLILMRISGAEQSQKLYRDLKQHRFGGVFHSCRPGLMVRDPELLKLFLQKDFNHFQDRGMMVADIKKNPIAAHLFNLEGAKWRNLRVKLNPTFTPGRMKMMFQLLNECAKELQAVLRQPADDGQVLEMRDVFAQYTTDVIGTCVFGLQFNSMKDPDSEFRRMGKKVFQSSFTASLRRFLFVGLPGVAKLFNLKFASDDVSNFFLKVVKETVEYREKNNVVRNDFMQLLIQLKNQGKLDPEDEDPPDGIRRMSSGVAGKGVPSTDTKEGDIDLTDKVLAAQAFVFFLAGFETSSTAMSFCMYELALNQDIQDQLRAEVDDTLQAHGDVMTYEAVQDMHYLDRIISE